MKFGLIYEMQRPHQDFEVNYEALIEETLEQCQLADEVGFDYLWFVEHHFLTTFSGSSAPEVIVSALAQSTKKIRLGFGVVVLPNHHPVQVAERIAMVDQLSKGRVEFGVGRSLPYEQLGLGVDPSLSREILEESTRIIPKIWSTSGNFSWEGKHFSIPERDILPKPYQKPHPPMWMACTQPSSYELAGKYGLGVLAYDTSSPSNMEPHIRRYKENCLSSEPVGEFINNQWASFTVAHCGENNEAAQSKAGIALREFFGPNRPYTSHREDVNSKLFEAWGGVAPEHLATYFQKREKGETDISGGNKNPTDLSEISDNLLSERGVTISGDPSSCINGVKKQRDAGVDQIIMLMQSDQITHEETMSSISLFGKKVIPYFNSDK